MTGPGGRPVWIRGDAVPIPRGDGRGAVVTLVDVTESLQAAKQVAESEARYRTLFEQDSIARQQLDTQTSLVRQYEGTLKVDRAAIDNARLQLTYTRIVAPLGGRLGLRQVDPGNIVRASDASGLVVITQLQPVTAIFTVPEDNLPAVMKRVRAGSRLPVDAYDRAGKNRLASGALLTVDNQIDPQAGSVRMRAVVDNKDGLLTPGLFAKVQIGKSGKFCGQSAVQMHGGMGVTDELSVSHYFKRLTMIDLMFGNQQHHLTRYSNLAMAA